ncbi:mechanosensitive ion channel family protein [Labrys okinawensis]|uniref:mechanosensitive ion channel family protein n=1 Tax=Labrys okinawensis TaxID=346911 RepID=UPI0039BCCC14
MRRSAWICCVLIGLALAASAALAQTAPPAQTPPASSPAMSQQQMDQMVDAISQAVMKKMSDKEKEKQPPKPAADSGAGMDMASTEQTEMFMEIGELATGLPALGTEFRHLGERLDAPMNQGRTVGSYFLLLFAAAALVLFTEWLVRLLLTPLRRRVADGMRGLHGVRALILLFALEIPPLLALWLVGNACQAIRFIGDMPQTRFSTAILGLVMLWRVVQALFRFTLQPWLPKARLPDLADADARRIYFGVSLSLLLLLVNGAVSRILVALESPAVAIGSAQLYSAIIMAAGMIAICAWLNRPVSHWFIGVTNPAHASPIKRSLARHWLIAAVIMFVSFAVADIYGAVTGRSNVPRALALTLAIVVGLLLLESLVHRLRILLQHRSEGGVHVVHPRGAEALARCARFGILIAAAALLARTWAVDASGMMAGDEFSRISSSMMAAALTAFTAYAAWELVRYFTDRYASNNSGQTLPPGLGAADEDVPLATASRIATLMPLLRIGLAIALAIMAVLTILTQLGVNVTPLIAGASIFGLAISFGSQTLVKDVVSGVFFLVDDAFRVGEYIDVGKAKGTVEGFTLRSLRLRHQNGPVHTIPYGQLGQVTNYSRDWSTIKFTLRFATDTDLEKLRKAVKKIGQDMLEDPEMKEEFLAPLKMQGVSDIVDNAIVVRFKFTVKPNKPTFIQREGLKRLVRILPEQGIEFASGAVSVRTIGGQVVPDVVAGAAISTAAAAAAPVLPGA